MKVSIGSSKALQYIHVLFSSLCDPLTHGSTTYDFGMDETFEQQKPVNEDQPIEELSEPEVVQRESPHVMQVILTRTRDVSDDRHSLRNTSSSPQSLLALDL